MAYEQLIESVELSGEERIRELKEKAYSKSEEIRKEAKGKDGAIKAKHLEAVKESVEVERNKAIAKIKQESRMQAIRAKEEIYQRAFLEAQKILSSVRVRSDYESIFKKMLKEAVAELEGEAIRLHIDKRDEELCKKLLPELHLNCEIATDITSAGGLNASTKDGRFIISNTIESRLEKAKGLLKSEISATLYGG